MSEFNYWQIEMAVERMILALFSEGETNLYGFSSILASLKSSNQQINERIKGYIYRQRRSFFSTVFVTKLA